MSLVMTTLRRMGQVSLGVGVRREMGMERGGGGQTSHVSTSSTGVRDYIHVVDLAKGHIAALKKLKEQCGCRVGNSGRKRLEYRVKGAHRVKETPINICSLGQIYNLGTGTGYSVLQMVQAMEKASGKKVGPTHAIGTPVQPSPPATLHVSA